MSLNRKDLIKRLNEASSGVLREKGYISFIDVLIRMGQLRKDDYENGSRGIHALAKLFSASAARG